MATYSKGILGAFNGKVGNVVGSSWRGIAVIRSLASKVKNPRTEPQLRVRNLLSLLSARLKLFYDAIQAGFVGSVSLGPWAAALKANWKRFFDDSTPSDAWSLDPARILLSGGSLAFAPVVSADRDGSVSVSWDAPEAGSSLYDASVYLVAFNEANAKSLTFTADASAGSLDADCASLLSGSDDQLHFYVFAASASCSSVQTYAAA